MRHLTLRRWVCGRSTRPSARRLWLSLTIAQGEVVEARLVTLQEYIVKNDKSGGALGRLEVDMSGVKVPFSLDAELLEMPGSVPWLVLSRPNFLRYGPSAWPLIGYGSFVKLYGGSKDVCPRFAMLGAQAISCHQPHHLRHLFQHCHDHHPHHHHHLHQHRHSHHHHLIIIIISHLGCGRCPNLKQTLSQLVGGSPCTFIMLPAEQLLSKGISLPDLGSYLETPSGAEALAKHSKIFDIGRDQVAWLPYGWVALPLTWKAGDALEKSEKAAEKEEEVEPFELGNSHVLHLPVLSSKVLKLVPEPVRQAINQWNKVYLNKNGSQKGFVARKQAFDAFMKKV